MGLGRKGDAHGVGTVGMCEGIAEGSVGVPWSCFVGAARNGVDLVRLREAVVVRLREAVVVQRIGWTTSSRSSVDRCGVSPRQCAASCFPALKSGACACADRSLDDSFNAFLGRYQLS